VAPATDPVAIETTDVYNEPGREGEFGFGCTRAAVTLGSTPCSAGNFP